MTFSGLGAWSQSLGEDASASGNLDLQSTQDEYLNKAQSGENLLDAAKETIEDETDKYLRAAVATAAAAGCAATGAGVAAAPICGWVAGKLYGPVKEGIVSVGKFFVSLFGGKKPKPPIRISAAEYVASYAKMTPLQKEYWDLYYANQTLDCMRVSALMGVLNSMVTSLNEIAPGEYDTSWALAQLRDAGLPLDEYTAWRLQGRDYVSYMCDSGTPGLPETVRFEWHLDYLPARIARLGSNDWAKKVAIEQGFKGQSFWWIDELERASMAVMTAAVVRGIKGRIPTPNQIMYLAAAMSCDQLAPRGCWENETALVGALCAGSTVPKDVMPEVWKAFCAKLGTCGQKPLCSEQNADLIAYAAALKEAGLTEQDLKEAQRISAATGQPVAVVLQGISSRMRRNRLLLLAGGAVAIGGAAWWFTRRR
jgi:hypothetical protein